jgi:hypothetical protein
VDKNFEYGRIYNEIAKGFSEEKINKKTFYFKHPNFSEYFGIYNNYDVILKDVQRQGLPTEEDKIKEAIEEGWWSKEKEMEMQGLKKTVENLIKTKSKLVLPSQREGIDKQIRRTQGILMTFAKERNEIVSFTAEDYTSKRFLDETVIALTFKNRELTEYAFTQEDYYNLSDGFSDKIKGAFNKYSNVFGALSLKHVAASGFFQNLVYLNEDAYSFWGKPTVLCTKYQIDLLVYGKMYKNLIRNYAENGKPVPDDVVSDAEKFVLWVENQTPDKKGSPIKSRKKTGGNNMVSSTVGATPEDLKKMGTQIDKLKGGKTLLQMAQEAGGTLEKEQYLKARENR